MAKTILLLGGSAQQLDSFAAARRLGCRIVLCDYDLCCPGRELADVFYEVSTVDRDAVLDVARREGVGGVVSYASDAPAPVAAWVSEQLGLAGNPPEAVSMMCDKGRFRSFLEENGFSVPANVVVRGAGGDDARRVVRAVGVPCVVKPVDSAGSRGVTVVRDEEDVAPALSRALCFSRKGEAVAEQRIESRTRGRVIEAEIFVEKGEIVSWGLMSAFRDLSLNGIVPSCYVHPLIGDGGTAEAVRQVLSRLIECSGVIQGPLNIELIEDARGDLYVIDVGPRNGGNYLPRFFSFASGDDLVEATLRVALGEPSGLRRFEGSDDGVWVQLMHYARESGTFRGFSTTEDYEWACMETHLYKEVGSSVEPLSSISDSIGVSLLHFPHECDVEGLVARLPLMCQTVVD
ncbi:MULTISPECIES: acetyl-CoA carboxylase biotin carboxylase subunit family protein [unclassified Adlercreutzia]|uniref:ATP-grasp domain-containing protein n=1 Tax=unclassified Adlercreutzia TaxID=2636013 RepID=UPI0013EC18D8|nr:MULTISPECIES: ATP-grasp domain-containing protein [unclassified Adlercreutzia]